MSSCLLLVFPLLVGLASSHLLCLCFSVSQSRNCARLHIVATSVLKVPILSWLKWRHMACGNNIHDVIIAHWHVISGDTQTSQPTDRENIKGQPITWFLSWGGGGGNTDLIPYFLTLGYPYILHIFTVSHCLFIHVCHFLACLSQILPSLQQKFVFIQEVNCDKLILQIDTHSAHSSW